LILSGVGNPDRITPRGVVVLMAATLGGGKRMTSNARTLVMACCSVAWLLGVSSYATAQQQMVDPDFHPDVRRPAYSRGGPTIAIDEAHDNFHTMNGQYAPLAELLRNDGYRVIASNNPFEKEDLAGIRILIIANARDLKAILAGDISKPAFTHHEC